MLNIGVFASHGGSNLQAIIDACKNQSLNAKVCVVISNNSSSFALERARNAGIPGFHISAVKQILLILEKHGVEIVVLAGYLKKLGKKVLQKYKGRILNIHPALLPKYGGQGMYGRNVHEAVIKSKDPVTGVTIHLVDEEYDRGPIINQCEVMVADDDTPETLAERVLEREHTFLVETLKLVEEGKLPLSPRASNQNNPARPG
jgi:phosphoribosylglycinamide formyltransferase-1